MSSVRFFCFSFQNPERKARMEARFKQLDLPYTFVEPVPIDDPRIPTNAHEKRTDAIMWSHLDMIRAFLNSDASHGIFCEDDIYIRRDLPDRLEELVAGYRRASLDVLLLGYLQPSPLVTAVPWFSLTPGGPATFLGYHDDLWGSQMYLMDRRWASAVLERCAAGSSGVVGPFSPDWTLTKWGRRALVWPMMAVEEGVVVAEVDAHRSFHARCTAANYDPTVHI